MISVHAKLDGILAKIKPGEDVADHLIREMMHDHAANIVKAAFTARDGSRIFRYGHNARTNAGAQYISQALFQSNSAALNYLALSSATLTPAMGDTTLTSEITTSGLGRKVATYGGYVGPASLGAIASSTLSASYVNNGGTAVNVTSVAIFNAASAGTMGFESNLNAGNTLNPGDSVAITYNLQV